MTQLVRRARSFTQKYKSICETVFRRLQPRCYSGAEELKTPYRFRGCNNDEVVVTMVSRDRKLYHGRDLISEIKGLYKVAEKSIL